MVQANLMMRCVWLYRFCKEAQCQWISALFTLTMGECCLRPDVQANDWTETQIKKDVGCGSWCEVTACEKKNLDCPLCGFTYTRKGWTTDSQWLMCEIQFFLVRALPWKASLWCQQRETVVQRVLSNHKTSAPSSQRPEQWEVTSENVLTVIQEITSIRDRPRDELSAISINIHEDKMFWVEEINWVHIQPEIKYTWV